MTERVTVTAPNHAEAKALGIRFRHLHSMAGRPRVLGAGPLRGTMCCRDAGNGRVEIAITIANPKDHNITRRTGRDLAYTRLCAGQTITMPLAVFKDRLRDHTLVDYVAGMLLPNVPYRSIRGVL